MRFGSVISLRGRARRALLAGTIAVTAQAGFGWLAAETAAAPTIDAADVVISAAVSASSASASCAGSGVASAAIRFNVDTLDDTWRARAQSRGATTFAPIVLPVEIPVAATPETYSFTGSSVTVAVSLRDVPHDQLPPYGGPSGGAGVGTPATTNSNGPTTGVSSTRTLQDCAPYPAQFYGTSAATQSPMWNEVAGNGTDVNAVLFTFSSPVSSFGAWFGDLETRADTAPGWIKLFDASGVVSYEGPIVTAADTGVSDATCGGSPGADTTGCGNRSTRWVGFSLPGGQAVSSMLVAVGDDDSCAQVTADQCNASTEHLSWIGATLTDLIPAPTTTSTSSTSTSTSTSTSSTSTSSTSTSTSTTTPTTTTSPLVVAGETPPSTTSPTTSSTTPSVPTGAPDALPDESTRQPATSLAFTGSSAARLLVASAAFLLAGVSMSGVAVLLRRRVRGDA